MAIPILKPAHRPPRQGPEAVNRRFSPFERRKLPSNVLEPGKILLAQFFPQGTFGLLQRLI